MRVDNGGTNRLESFYTREFPLNIVGSSLTLFTPVFDLNLLFLTPSSRGDLFRVASPFCKRDDSLNPDHIVLQYFYDGEQSPNFKEKCYSNKSETDVLFCLHVVSQEKYFVVVRSPSDVESKKSTLLCMLSLVRTTGSHPDLGGLHFLY